MSFEASMLLPRERDALQAFKRALMKDKKSLGLGKQARMVPKEGVEPSPPVKGTGF